MLLCGSREDPNKKSCPGGTERRFCPVISESMVRLLALKYLSRVLNCVDDTAALV